MARSPSPLPSSKRRRRDVDDSPRSDQHRRDSHRSDRDRKRDRSRSRDRERDRDRRPKEYDDYAPPRRDRSRSSDRHRRGSSRRDRDAPRDRSRSPVRRRPSSRDRERDWDRDRRSVRRDSDRAPSRSTSLSPVRRSRSPDRRRSRSPNGRATPLGPIRPAEPAKSAEEEEKQRLKREKLAAWKAKKAAEKKDGAPTASTSVPGSPVPSLPSTPKPEPAVALPPPLAASSLPAKPVAPVKTGLPSKPLGSTTDAASRALAAAASISNRLAPPVSKLSSSLPASLPAKPSFSFSSASNKPSGLKNTIAMGEDEHEHKIGMIKLEGAVDMTMGEARPEDEDDEDLEGGVVYQAREGGRDARVAPEGEEEAKMDVDPPPTVAPTEEEEIDELDAFMNTVQAQVKSVDKEDRAKLSASKGRKATIVEPGEEEEEEEEQPPSEDEAEKVGTSAAEILALAAKKVRRGRELHAVDHSKIAYEPFRKAFYHAPPEVEALTQEEVDELRLEMDDIKVRGADPPKPVAKWSYCGLPAPCIEVIKGLEYAAPTSIQSQAIPAIMSGRDIIGVAKTGSGKTMAFILPMFRHIKDQRPLKTMEGPIGMIMTPTRELATQIFKECKPFLKALGLRASCAYGGTPLKDNIADMKRGAEVIVCTPGRMIELLTTNSGRVINLHRITYLVLDEADRMFDMGFEPQVMKIINQIRPDRQTVLFSATFPRQMEALARKILRRPLEITVGGRSIVAPEIEQIVEVRDEDSKFLRLLELLGRISNEDSDARTLIFVERQEGADKLLTELLKKNYVCMSLHGGMEQVDRDQTIADFKSGVVPVVIATSVAARGLDVKQLKLVVQYDAPNHMEDYVHRAGRTGRAGNKGTCVTFVTPDQDRYALDIFKALTASGAKVPDELKALAEGFAEKVKAGKASGASSGFGGKGLEKLDSERDALSRAEHAIFGVDAGASERKTDDATATAGDTPSTAQTVADLEVEIKRGPAPDTSRKGSGNVMPSSADAHTLAVMKAAEQAALAAGKPAGVAKAQSVIANFNAMLRSKAAGRPSESDLSTDSARRRDPDATDYHAIVYINDYPQKARWKVTNKETMVMLIESTGAAITNKGVYYEPGKEPGPDELPKLHLLIESNDEFRVKQAITEIKRALIEGATMALEAEQRNPGTAPGRYSVV